MVLQECRCLPKNLEVLIREAVSTLKDKKVTPQEIADAQSRSAELEKHLIGLESLGIKVTPEMMAQVSSIGKPASVKLFDDLEKYIVSCRCPEGTDFDWQAFPYHEYGYKTPRASTGGEACTLSPQEKEDITLRLTNIANKYIFSLRDPAFLAHMKNTYGEQLITGSNVRHEIVKQGRVNKQEMDEFYELAHKLDEGCGRKAGTTVRKYDTELLAERIDIGLIRKGKEEFFKKRT